MIVLKMTETQTLLAQYAQDGSEPAFRELVTRYIDLVYSTALRLVGADTHLAQDVAQTVFVDLARKARTLPGGVMLGGWLHQHTRFVAAKTMRGERRRQNRERQAAEMNAQDDHSESNLAQVVPILDEAISQLDAADRSAILLRYFEQKDLRAVGEALGSSEEAARKRVSRALDELRSLLKRRGVLLSAVALSSLLATQAVTAAPAGLATSIAGTALTSATSATSLLNVLAMTKTKLVLATAVLIAAVGTTVLLKNNSPGKGRELAAQNKSATAGHEADHSKAPAGQAAQLAEESEAVSNLVAAASGPELREPFPPTVHLSLSVPPGAVAVQPDGKIVIAATLSGFLVDEQSSVLGTYHRGAIRFRPDGTLDRSFLCQVNDIGACDPMRARLDLRADGRMLMTGLFKSVDGKPRPGYAMLLSDGRVDASFEPWRGMTNQPQMRFTHSATFPAALLEDGSVAVGNSAIERPEVSYLQSAYRLDASGRLIPSSWTNLPLPEFSRPSGLILTLGPVGFWTRKPINWTSDTRADTRPAVLAKYPACDFPFERWQEPPSAADAAAVFQALFEEVPFELCRYAVRLPDGGVVMAIREELIKGAMNAGGRFMRFDKNWRPTRRSPIITRPIWQAA